MIARGTPAHEKKTFLNNNNKNNKIEMRRKEKRGGKKKEKENPGFCKEIYPRRRSFMGHLTPLQMFTPPLALVLSNLCNCINLISPPSRSLVCFDFGLIVFILFRGNHETGSGYCLFIKVKTKGESISRITFLACYMKDD